uniref:Uncharacterized protein n=1 Tax=Populus trichocarpa TaxID=3694 RepID=A0A3N7HRG2_POPTR
MVTWLSWSELYTHVFENCKIEQYAHSYHICNIDPLKFLFSCARLLFLLL